MTSRHPKLATAFLTILMASGCVYEPSTQPAVGNVNPIVVTSADQLIRLHQPSKSQLSDQLAKRGASRNDDILLAVAPQPESGQKLKELAKLLNELGYSNILAMAPEGLNLAAGEVAILLRQYQATSPRCPNTNVQSTYFANGPHPNFGCATSANLAAMLANPRDAVSGRKADPTSAESIALGQQRYLQDKVKSPQGAGAFKAGDSGGSAGKGE